MGRFRDRARRAARLPASPFLRYFNRRFEDVHGHVDNRTEPLATAARALEERVATDVEVVSELALTLERFADRFGRRMEDVLAELRRLLGAAAMPATGRRATVTLAVADDLAAQAAVLECLHRWLAPEGELVLTLPASAIDAAGQSLEGWEVLDRRDLAPPGDGTPGDGTKAVTLRLVPRG